MGIRERKEKEKTEMRSSILKAAMSLFIDEGYENVSMRKIAHKIEYSASSIYSYFENKDMILFELLHEGFEKLKEKQLSVQGITEPRERLIAHGDAYMDFAFENSQYYELMFLIHKPKERFDLHKVKVLGDSCYELLVKNVAECVEAGYNKGEDVNNLALFLWSSLHGIVALYIRQAIILEEFNKQYLYNIKSVTLHFLQQLIKK